MLNKLNDGKQLPKISSTITQHEFIIGMRKWKERTSTSPSSRHLGHYRVLGLSETREKENDIQPNTIKNPMGYRFF